MKMNIGREERRRAERRGRAERIRGVIKNVERVTREGGDGADVIKLKRSPAGAREETISCSLSTKTVRALELPQWRRHLTAQKHTKVPVSRMHRKHTAAMFLKCKSVGDERDFPLRRDRFKRRCRSPIRDETPFNLCAVSLFSRRANFVPVRKGTLRLRSAVPCVIVERDLSDDDYADRKSFSRYEN